jgi:hypothetical protein
MHTRSIERIGTYKEATPSLGMEMEGMVVDRTSLEHVTELRGLVPVDGNGAPVIEQADACVGASLP